LIGAKRPAREAGERFGEIHEPFFVLFFIAIMDPEGG
jgi:hypothetical protein